MGEKIIVLKDEGQTTQNHDILQSGETLTIEAVDIPSLLSNSAGNVFRLGSDGKLYVNNLCDETNPDNPTKPSDPTKDKPEDTPKTPPSSSTFTTLFLAPPDTPNPPIIIDTPSSPYPEPKRRRTLRVIYLGRVVPNLNIGDGYHGYGGLSGGIGGFGIGGIGYGYGNGCGVPLACTGRSGGGFGRNTDRVFDAYIVTRGSNIGGNSSETDYDTFEEAMRHVPTSTPTHETEDSMAWITEGGVVRPFVSLEARKGRKCQARNIANVDREDGLWVVKSDGNTPPPSLIRTTIDGCAACMRLVGGHNLGSEDTGDESGSSSSFGEGEYGYTIEENPCALNRSVDKENWHNAGDGVDGLSAGEGVPLSGDMGLSDFR